MMIFLTSWCVFYVMTCFWRHDVFFFYFMANFLSSWRFDVITNFFLISWCTLRTFDVMTYFLTLWHIFWRHDVLSIFVDLMTCFMIYFLTFWCTFWRYNVLLMSYFLQSWRTSWRHDLLYWRNDIFLVSYSFWHIPFHPNSLTNLDPCLFCCFLKATHCTCIVNKFVLELLFDPTTMITYIHARILYGGLDGG